MAAAGLMVWDTPAERAEFRAWERERRAYWRAHPEPVDRRPGRYGVPAWLGPDSPQSPVWLGPLEPSSSSSSSTSPASRAWAPSSSTAAALVAIGRIRQAA